MTVVTAMTAILKQYESDDMMTTCDDMMTTLNGPLLYIVTAMTAFDRNFAYARECSDREAKGQFVGKLGRAVTAVMAGAAGAASRGGV